MTLANLPLLPQSKEKGSSGSSCSSKSVTSALLQREGLMGIQNGFKKKTILVSCPSVCYLQRLML